MVLVIIVWVVNFAISIFNAWVVGKNWLATKRKGGLAHFMNWMGAIMSASGFTWCYTIALAAVGTLIPVKDGETYVPLVSDDMVQAVISLGYLVVILPILGSGLAITVSSWRSFARHRSAGDGAVAGWNTYAQVHNTVSAIQQVPDVLSGLGKFFGGSKSNGDNKGLIVIVLVVLAVLGGVATTFGIIRMAAASDLDHDAEKAREMARNLKNSASARGPSTPTAAPVGTRTR